MEIISQEDLNLAEIVEKLKAGATIVYPTETVYGLGCAATNQAAVDKIFQIKERQKDKPLLVVASGVDMMVEYVEWSDKLEELAKKYWPGPLTVVTEVQDRDGLANGVVAGDNTLAFRVTDHPLASEISQALGMPLVSTSANLSSQESSYDVADIVTMFKDSAVQPDIVIDAGILLHRSPSTVVKIVGEEVEVLRQGELIVE